MTQYETSAKESVISLAGVRERLKAFEFDYLLILCYLASLSVIGLLLTLGPLGESWSGLLSTPYRVDLLAFLTTVLPVAVYFTWKESSAYGATFGKKRMSLRVVGPNGERLSRPRAVARSCMKFLPWQMAHTTILHIPGFPMEPSDLPRWTVLLLGFMWVLVGSYLVGLTPIAGKRTFYDRLSGSYVIRPDDL